MCTGFMSKIDVVCVVPHPQNIKSKVNAIPEHLGEG